MNTATMNLLRINRPRASRMEDVTPHEWRVSSRGLLLLALVVLGGCAAVPADYGRGKVDALLADRGKTVDDATAELLASLTAAAITPESAIRIALINNPELQSTYATLGFGAADVYEAGRIRNPVFSGALLDSSVAGERDQVTLGLVTSFTDLVTLPARKRLARGAFAALQQSVGANVLEIAAQTEKTYYNYVGTQQVAALRAQIAKAGALSAALATRYREAGNLTPRELALERAAASQTRLIALEAEAEAYGARTELAALLGLSVGEGWKVPAQLHLPLQTEDELDTLLALAKDARLDLASAHAQADVQADRLGVVNWTRWLGNLDIGGERERETDGARLTGPTASWEVPIFNQHKDVLLRADAQLQIAINDVRRIATDVDNSVRLAYATLENTRARINEYYDVFIPQRIEAVARAQEEVNYMLIGIFELIALKQDEYDAYQGYLEAIRDYWLARADLGLATGTTLPSSSQLSEQRIDVDQFIRPPPGGMDHSGHGSMGDDAPMMNKENTGSKSMDHSGHIMQQNNKSPEPIDHSGHEMKKNMKTQDKTNESERTMHHQHDDGDSQ